MSFVMDVPAVCEVNHVPCGRPSTLRHQPLPSGQSERTTQRNSPLGWSRGALVRARRPAAMKRGSMPLPGVLALASSSREDSFNKKLIRIGGLGVEAEGLECTLVDLRDFEPPLLRRRPRGARCPALFPVPSGPACGDQLRSIHHSGVDSHGE